MGASCGASTPALTRPRHDGPRAFNNQVSTDEREPPDPPWAPTNPTQALPNQTWAISNQTRALLTRRGPPRPSAFLQALAAPVHSEAQPWHVIVGLARRQRARPRRPSTWRFFHFRPSRALRTLRQRDAPPALRLAACGLRGRADPEGARVLCENTLRLFPKSARFMLEHSGTLSYSIVC